MVLPVTHDDRPVPSDQGDGRSPWTRPRFVTAAAVVALLVLLGAVVALTGRGDDGSTAAPPSTTAGQDQPATDVVDDGPADDTPTDPADDTGGESTCGLPAGDQTIPAAVAPPTTWELVGGLATPTDPDTYGPGQISDNGVRSCYSRDPVGALYAATNFLAQADALDADGLRQLAEQISSEGTGRAAFLAQVDRLELESAQTDTRFAFAGYEYITYTPEVAVFDLALQVGADTVSLPVTLQWTNGQWLYVTQPNGSVGQPEAVPSLAGFVPWSAS